MAGIVAAAEDGAAVDSSVVTVERPVAASSAVIAEGAAEASSTVIAKGAATGAVEERRAPRYHRCFKLWTGRLGRGLRGTYLLHLEVHEEEPASPLAGWLGSEPFVMSLPVVRFDDASVYALSPLVVRVVLGSSGPVGKVDASLLKLLLPLFFFAFFSSFFLSWLWFASIRRGVRGGNSTMVGS
jgi:hypothetical protein